jgi:membrane protease YdiL (CAAX protease family)
MNTIIYKGIEFLIIFILMPVSFALDYSVWIKMSIGISGFMYIIYVLVKVEQNKFKLAPNLNWKVFWLGTFLKLLLIAVITTLFVLITDKQSLFNVLTNKPKLWIIILFVYSLFSVYPQELIYRTFYFQRYQSLVENQYLFIFINAILFSLAHLFFRNGLVIALTFFGGVLFGLTFHKTKSTLLVSIEHAIYGCWLFTVGMGGMLGFPG